jgi:hypothetical protein
MIDPALGFARSQGLKSHRQATRFAIVAASSARSWLVRARRCGLLALAVAPWTGFTIASALAKPGVETGSQARDGGLSFPAAATGRPLCVRVSAVQRRWHDVDTNPSERQGKTHGQR